jgi:hypothetical protein
VRSSHIQSGGQQEKPRPTICLSFNAIRLADKTLAKPASRGLHLAAVRQYPLLPALAGHSRPEKSAAEK